MGVVTELSVGGKGDPSSASGEELVCWPVNKRDWTRPHITNTLAPSHTLWFQLFEDWLYVFVSLLRLLQDLVFGVYLISATSPFLSFLSSIWFFLVFSLFSLHIASAHPHYHFLCLQRLNRIHFWVLSDLDPLPWDPPPLCRTLLISLVLLSACVKQVTRK